MRIRQASADLHRQPVAHPGWRLITGPVTEVPCWLVRVEAEDGTTGWGAVEAMLPFTLPPAAIGACLDLLLPLLTGQDATDCVASMGVLNRALFGVLPVKAAIDCALHDLAARLLDQPLHQVLGGAVNHVLPVTRLVPLGPPGFMADFAEALVARGYSVLKLKIDGRMEEDVARVRAIRMRVGPDIRLMADANGAYDAATAIRCIARLDEHDIALVEQPVPGADLDGLAAVARAVRPVIEADESATDLATIRRLAEGGAVGSISLRVPRLGGIAATLDAARLCAEAGIVPRMGVCFLPSVFQATALHVASCFHALPLAHELAEHELFRDDPFEPLPVTAGLAALPRGSGTGIQPAHGDAVRRGRAPARSPP